jgi:tetratricopeptide (TPR) repeat protein
MMAILNFAAKVWRQRTLPSLLVAAITGMGALTSHAEPPSAPAPAAEEKAAARFQDIYRDARERWQARPTNAELAWQFSRAAFDWAELATNDTQRAEIAEQGIAAGRKAVALQSNLAAVHYYLALNLGQLARTKLLGALRLVEEMEDRFKRSIELDAKFEYAGAHRSLGLLYRDAPGWPTSIGSRGKAREHLQKAVELCPEYPGNRLALMESLIKWGEKKTAQTQVVAVEEFLKSARSQFAGDRWVLDWLDWNQRWEKVKAKASVVAAREEE